MMATIPVFIALGEIVFLGTQKLTGGWRLRWWWALRALQC
jgi:hypothetical protein